MRRRIYHSMLLLTLSGLLLAGLVLSFTLYPLAQNAAIQDARNQANLLRAGYAMNPGFLTAVPPGAGIRVTHVSAAGDVLSDSEAEAADMDNHLDREEVAEALRGGAGESERFSVTSGEKAYYYALLLDDGTVLRVSKPIARIWQVFTNALVYALFALLLAFVVSNWIASRLTRHIIAPLNALKLDGGDEAATFDELAPLTRTIQRQRERISTQVQDLEKRAATIDAITEGMSEGMLLLGKDQTVVAANRSALMLFAVDRAKAIGKNLLETVRDAAFLQHAQAAIDGARGEMVLKRGERCYQVVFSPANDQGALVFLLDTTERTRAERMRREFSANVSHELKTPLTSISGYAEMMRNGLVKSGDTERFLEKIQDEARRLISLIEDIMLLSRLDEGEEREAFQPVNLMDTAREVQKELSGKAKDEGVDVTVDGENARVLGNPAMMGILAFNLMDNAIKYNRPGGSVRMEVKREGGRVRMTVEDTGIGIPAADQDRVFERFYRVDKSRSKRTGGTGLGLAIVKHIVSVHGGEIHVESQIGKGTRMIVDLPEA